MNQHAFFFVAEARDQLAFVVGDEGVAVIALDRAVVFLHADAVCGDDGDGIGNGVALHRPLPLQMRVEGRVLRLGADRGGIEQDFRTLQHHAARGFGIPLVPANADADSAVLGAPHLEAGIAGPEIIFLQIARPVGDMALAIDAKDRAVCVGNRHAVVMTRAVLFEEGDGDDDAKLLGELGESKHGRVLTQRIGGGEPFRVLMRGEIDALEQLGWQDDLRALTRGLAHQAFDLGDVLLHVMAERGLDRGDGNLARHQSGSSRVMQ